VRLAGTIQMPCTSPLNKSQGKPEPVLTAVDGALPHRLCPINGLRPRLWHGLQFLRLPKYNKGNKSSNAITTLLQQVCTSTSCLSQCLTPQFYTNVLLLLQLHTLVFFQHHLSMNMTCRHQLQMRGKCPQRVHMSGAVSGTVHSIYYRNMFSYVS